MARQLRNQAEKVTKGLNLSMEALEPIAEMLDTAKAMHIETLYFTLNGDYFLNVYQWSDKVYSRLEWVPVEIGNKRLFQKQGFEKDLIVEALDAQEIVDKVIAWKASGRVNNEVDLNSISKPLIEKKLSVKEKIEIQKKLKNK